MKNASRIKPAEDVPTIPNIVAWRVDQSSQGLLAKWRRANPSVPWGKLIRRAVLKELQPLCGKRYAALQKEVA